MYRFDLEGYAYGAALPIDITWWGYNYIYRWPDTSAGKQEPEL